MHAVNNRTILVGDDNPFNREGLVLFLENAGYATCQAGDELAAFATAEDQQPIGAIVDIVIPTRAGGEAMLNQSVGLALAARLKRLDPAMGVVVFSAYDDRGPEVWAMVRDGTRGLAYMLKGGRPESLLDALEQALDGKVVLDPNALNNSRNLADEIRQQLSVEERPWVLRAVSLMPTLTERELDVAQRLADSQNLMGIAQSLNITQATVENHLTSLYSKLELSGVDDQAPSLRKSTLLAKACMLYELSLMDKEQR